MAWTKIGNIASTVAGPKGNTGDPATVNGKSGSSITLTAADVGAATTAQGTAADGAAQKSANLSDLTNPIAARSNLWAASDRWGGDEASSVPGTTTGTVTLDAFGGGSVFTITPTGNITLAFTNLVGTGRAQTYTVIITQSGTVRTVTLPGDVVWMSENPVQKANKVCIFTLLTVDGGTAWYAWAQVQP